MDIDAMRYFVELVRDGSFNKAAKRLFISQQGLNRAITSLESKLGVTLVERGPSGVAPTAEGRIFLNHAISINEDYRAMTEEILSCQAERITAAMEHLHVTTTPYLVAIGFDRIWDVESMDIVSVREWPLHRILESVPASHADDLFVADLFPKTQRRIDEDAAMAFDPIFTTYIGIIKSKGFPWNEKGPLRCESVLDLPMAYTNDSTNNGLIAYLFKGRSLSNACLQSSSPETLIEWVRARRVVSLFDSYAFYLLQKNQPEALDDIEFVPFAEKRATDTVGYLFRSDVALADEVRSFIANSKLIFKRDNADYLRRYPLQENGHR